ncbi:hypothetical protein Tco_1046438, partial [Tanacetum coccineum]
ELDLEAKELLFPLAGAEDGSLNVIPFKVSSLNVDFDFKFDLTVFGPEPGSAPSNFFSFEPVSAMRALTSVSSSSDDTSSLSQSYDSTMRPLFLLENELGAEALELRNKIML